MNNLNVVNVSLSRMMMKVSKITWQAMQWNHMWKLNQEKQEKKWKLLKKQEVSGIYMKGNPLYDTTDNESDDSEN